MKLATISAEEFNLQAYTEPNASIYQSTYYADYMIKNDYRPLFLSYNNDLNVSTALAMLLIKKKSLFFSKYSAYAPKGYLINYYDTEMLKQFNYDLAIFLKHEKVDTLIIEPDLPLKDHEYLIFSLENLGYQKTKSLYSYELNVQTYKPIRINRNIILDIKTITEPEIAETYKAKEEAELYHAFEKYVVTYEASLDSYRTKLSFKNSIEDHEDYILSHQGDYKFREKIEERKAALDNDKYLLKCIDEYEKAYGVNPALGICCMLDYSGRHSHLFTLLKDSNDPLGIDKLLLNYIVNEQKRKEVDIIYSQTELPNSERVELLGEFTLNI
ncbi:MAG: peptidoglycan bridge formation glycyltransferase FemA/FemB family protein [Erysipelotrichaceae bacterium]|nr:peptidoglycan bridge formation glycyltransferase FemA/FemB family protein [Erysipelotrichaceae bacterium]